MLGVFSVSVGNLWPTTTSLLNNQFSLSFSCETNSCQLFAYCYFNKTFLFSYICANWIFFFSWKAPLLLLRTQGWISVFCKSSRWFWCRLGPPSRHLPFPFSPRKVWATFSTPLSVKVYILLGFIHYVLVEIMCNQGFWDLCGFPAAKILLNLWIK